MPGAVTYCRVSTKEQTQNLSLPTQERQCRMYCDQNGFSVERVFVEEGESAKTTNRRQFQNMLLYCREHKKKVDYVVVYSLSRFSRHTADHHEIKALLSSFGVRLRSATEPIDDSSSGKFIESMIAAVSQFDNDVRSERTVVGMKAAADEGRWTFPAPLGYRTVSTNGSSRMEPDPDRAPLVRSAFELFATGRYEQQQVLKKVTAKGLRTRRGKKVPLQSFNAMLRKPIYAGRICISSWGIDRRGEFVPIVRCERCDQPLTASWSKGRTKKYAYYRCSQTECKFVNTPKTIVEDTFIELMKGLQPRPRYVRLFKAIVLDVWKNQQAEEAKSTQALRTRIDKILERRNRLDEAFIYDQKIDNQTYQAQLGILREEQALAQMELNEARVDELDIETVVNFAIEAIGDASRFWLDATIDQKQRFQQVLFPEGLAFDGEKFGTAATCLAFSYLQQVSAGQSSLASRTGVEPVSPP